MPNKTPRTKKVTLSPADHKHVRRIAAKTKMSDQQVVEKALDAARPLLKLITKAVSARRSVGGSRSFFFAALSLL
jgi:hypothetical protein